MIEKKRRRTCADRMRRDLVECQRRKRDSNPAGAVMLKLLGVLSVGLALLPPLPSFSFAAPSRKTVSSPPGKAARRQSYDDGPGTAASSFREANLQPYRAASPHHLDSEDRGPTAHAMEFGIDPPYYRTSSRAAPSWTRLVKDLRRRSTSGRARALIEYRVPPEARLWLYNMIEAEDWRPLLLLGRDGAREDEIAAAALTEAQRWAATQAKPPELAASPAPDVEGSGGLRP